MPVWLFFFRQYCLPFPDIYINIIATSLGNCLSIEKVYEVSVKIPLLTKICLGG